MSTRDDFYEWLRANEECLSPVEEAALTLLIFWDELEGDPPEVVWGKVQGLIVSRSKEFK